MSVTISEEQLQEWFEQKADAKALGAAVTNRGAVKEQLLTAEAGGRLTDQAARRGLRHALDAIDTLQDANRLSANSNIAPKNCDRMKPDLVLFNENASYILIELKTQRGSERQGVQELLAYSMAIKMQAPYVNDFVYVIVSNDWSSLLEYGVRALILDGKKVLPLCWAYLESGEFSLEVKLDLFRFDFVKPYDPMQAVSTARLAQMCPLQHVTRVLNHLNRCAFHASVEAARLQQSGFVVSWSYETAYQWEMMNLTTAAVNQHWLHSEYLPSNYEGFLVDNTGAFGDRISERAAIFRATGAIRVHDGDSELQEATGNEAAAHMFPQNSIAYDLLAEGVRRAGPMWFPPKDLRLDDPEISPEKTLEFFIQRIAEDYRNTFRHCLLIGELADYARSLGRSFVTCFDDLVELLDLFQEHKGGRPREHY